MALFNIPSTNTKINEKYYNSKTLMPEIRSVCCGQYAMENVEKLCKQPLLVERQNRLLSLNISISRSEPLTKLLVLWKVGVMCTHSPACCKWMISNSFCWNSWSYLYFNLGSGPLSGVFLHFPYYMLILVSNMTIQLYGWRNVSLTTVANIKAPWIHCVQWA